MSENLFKINEVITDVFTCELKPIFKKPQKITGVFTNDITVEKIDGEFVTTMWQGYLLDTGSCNGLESEKTISDEEECIFKNRPEVVGDGLEVIGHKTTYEIDENTNKITIITIVNYTPIID